MAESAPKKRKVVGEADIKDQKKRSMRFAVSVAAQMTMPASTLRGGHPVGLEKAEGYYYEVVGAELTENDVAKMQKSVEEQVAADTAVKMVTKPWKEAVDYFEKHNQPCAKALLATRVTEDVSCYELPNGILRLAMYPLFASYGELKDCKLKLELCTPGFVVFHGEAAPEAALLGSCRDHKVFAESNGVVSVGQLNSLQQVGRSRKDYILQCEFRQEAKLADIARACQQRKEGGRPIKIIAVAGPTSSGKTTFATKLCMYLGNLGFIAKSLTVDHYYLPLDRQPKYQARKNRADVDYDSIESMDVDLVGEQLNQLIDGKPVMTPIYNMKTGYRDEPGHQFDALPANGILVIEGIHALNPEYTKAVQADKVFKIFISPLTSLQLDDFNVVKSTNHRLLRRMCRDYLFRGNSASVTLRMWNNVRQGEDLWIYPHQNNADFVMNSAADYEIGVLKTFLEPLLRAVPRDDANIERADQVLELLDRFVTFPPDLTPTTALLREFIGDGAYDCH